MTGQKVLCHTTPSMMSLRPFRAPRQEPPEDASPASHQVESYAGSGAGDGAGDRLRACAQSVPGISIDQAAALLTSSRVEFTVAPAWEFNTGGSIETSPCLGPDGTIYVANSAGVVTALKDGKKLWAQKVHDRRESDTPSDSPEVRETSCLSPDGRVYYGYHGHKVYALDTNNKGKRLWEYDTGQILTSYPPCAGPDGTVYVGDLYGKVFALKDGKKLWDSQTAGHIVEPACLGPDGTLYVGFFHGKIIALDTKNKGEVLWEHNNQIAAFALSCPGDDGILYVGNDRGDIYALDTRNNRKELWNFRTGGSIVKKPILAPDGTLYVGSWDKRVYALDTNNKGKKLWDFETGGHVVSPCLGSDGTVYVGSQDGKVYALRSSLVVPESSAGEGDAQCTPCQEKTSVDEEDGWLIIGDQKLRINEARD